MRFATYAHSNPLTRIDPSGQFDKEFFHEEAVDVDAQIMAGVGSVQIPGAYWVGSNGNQGGLEEGTAWSNRKYSQSPSDWRWVQISEILETSPRGSGIPIIVHSCLIGNNPRLAEQISRAAGAVVYATKDYAFVDKRGPGIYQAFAAKKNAQGGPGARSSFTAFGNGVRAFGDEITSIIIDTNTGMETVTWRTIPTGSNIPRRESVTRCVDPKKCGK